MKGASTRNGVSAVLDAKGVMEPWQEPRSGRGWFVLVLGIAVFAAFGGVVGYAYFKGLPGIGGEPPLIRAEPGPYRMAPGDRGGLAISNANSRIVSVLSDKPDEARVERILPPETSPAFEASEPEPTVRMPENAGDQPGRLAATEPSATPPATSDLGTVAPDGIPAADALALPYPRSKPLPPAADLGILLPLQTVMVTAVIYLSGRATTFRTAGEWIGSLGLVGAGAGARYALREVLRQALKWTGPISGALAATGTWALGQAAQRHFIEGSSMDEARSAFEAARREGAQR